MKISVEKIVDDVRSTIRRLLIHSVLVFLTARLTATSFMQLELALLSLVRELGRNMLQRLLQLLETGRKERARATTETQAVPSGTPDLY
jgi:hypothetical protein